MSMPPPGQGPIDPNLGGSRASYPPRPSFQPPQPVIVQKQRPSFTQTFLATVMYGVFSLSIGLNIVFLISWAARNAGAVDRLRETTIVSGGSDKVVVLKISGIIDDRMATYVKDSLKRIENDASVKALVLEIDSPGGGVTASDEIYHRVLQYKQSKRLPIVVAMNGIAASGGYYVACAADTIYAQPTTITGSIGVILPRVDFSRLANSYGVDDGSIISTGATYKNVGSPLEPLNPEGEAYLRSLIDESFTQFKTVVTTGRAGKLKGPLDDIANGKAFAFQQAKALGLVDASGYLDDAIAAASSGLTSPSVVRIDRDLSIFDLLGAQSKASTPPVSIKLGGASIEADSETMQWLQSPRPMFLWRGQ